VAAVALAAERIEGLKGLFLGDGPERGTLDAAIAEHGMTDVISAPGFAAEERVDAEMRRALCLLLPSRREGYGMVVVEAAARATPSVVVAGEDNAATELLAEGVNGEIASRADAGTIADAIVRVHEAGFEMRVSTGRWFTEHARELSLDESLRTVLAGYSGARA
jgi:glycosyltransferase involved in cell wall biosynthesis